MTIRTLKSEEQLKPCPFCGGTAIVRYIKDESYHKIIVGCSKCWCEITKTLGRWGQVDIKDAVKKWNTRAESEDKE